MNRELTMNSLLTINSLLTPKSPLLTMLEIVAQKSVFINEIYGLYILETALKSTSCATEIFSSSKIRDTSTDDEFGIDGLTTSSPLRMNRGLTMNWGFTTIDNGLTMNSRMTTNRGLRMGWGFTLEINHVLYIDGKLTAN
jgi:hypothetical protein